MAFAVAASIPVAVAASVIAVVGVVASLLHTAAMNNNAAALPTRRILRSEGSTSPSAPAFKRAELRSDTG